MCTPAFCASGSQDWICPWAGTAVGFAGSQMTETRFVVRPTSVIVAKKAAGLTSFPRSSLTPTDTAPLAPAASASATMSAAPRPPILVTESPCGVRPTPRLARPAADVWRLSSLIGRQRSPLSLESGKHRVEQSSAPEANWIVRRQVCLALCVRDCVEGLGFVQMGRVQRDAGPLGLTEPNRHF